MLRNTFLLAVLVLLSAGLSACGIGATDEEEGASTPVGDVANGEVLFARAMLGPDDAPGCITCHSLEPDVVIVGPSMVGLATRAAARVPGQSAEAYIREAILNPDAYLVEGYAPGVMYQQYGLALTPEQIDDLTAFLLTLE